MGDVFKEQLVKKKPTAKDMMKKAGIVGLGIAICITVLFVPLLQSLFLFIAVAIGFGVYYVLGFFNIEYEYAFTNGELDIDIIYNQERRKRVYSGNVREFEIKAHVDDREPVQHFNNVDKVIDYSSGVSGPSTYVVITTHKGKRIKMIIEPNDGLLQAFSTVLTPRKLIRKK